jgi:hypothetical protein
VLSEVVFESDSHLIEVDGFRGFGRLKAFVSSNTFTTRVFRLYVAQSNLLAANGQLIKIKGFYGCPQLCSVDIPASVQVISLRGFSAR